MPMSTDLSFYYHAIHTWGGKRKNSCIQITGCHWSLLYRARDGVLLFVDLDRFNFGKEYGSEEYLREVLEELGDNTVNTYISQKKLCTMADALLDGVEVGFC